MKECLFNSKQTINEYKQLMDYCVQDIQSNENLEESLAVYSKLTHTDENVDCDRGIVFLY